MKSSKRFLTLLSLALLLGLTTVTGCRTRFGVDPASPVPFVLSSPTTTPTANCAIPLATIPLPGVIGTQFYVYLSGPGTPTPTPTLTPAPMIIYGVIRNQADWEAYCAGTSLDPLQDPCPVDLTQKMIVYRPYSPNFCGSNSYFSGVCLYGDRIEVVVTSDVNTFVMCPHVLLPNITIFEGLILDQSSLPVNWFFLNTWNGSHFPSASPIPMGTPILIPRYPFTPTPTPTP